MRKNNKRVGRGRTASGRIPQGRTLVTKDCYLPIGKRGVSKNKKEKRPVVVIEANSRNEVAVVPLSSKAGKNRTRLKNYQQGKSYFKHFVEIDDNEGKPIVVGEKFRENHANMDVSQSDVQFIKDKIFYNSVPKNANRQKINKFRDKDKKE